MMEGIFRLLPAAAGICEGSRRLKRVYGARRSHAGWGDIAAAGSYDQPHLITEFRAIAGVTPYQLGELHITALLD